LEKKEHGKEFFFAGNWKGFPRIPGTGKQKKGTQKGMHNLAVNILSVRWNFGGDVT
jgi:hypothetical protein